MHLYIASTYTVSYISPTHPPVVHWPKFVAGQDVVCLTFLHFAEQCLKQLFIFLLYSCKTMKCHCHALTLSKKYEIVSFWKSNKHLSQRDIALCFGIPTSMLGDMLKIATKIKVF
jgi:hypothetical protein